MVAAGNSKKVDSTDSDRIIFDPPPQKKIQMTVNQLPVQRKIRKKMRVASMETTQKLVLCFLTVRRKEWHCKSGTVGPMQLYRDRSAW